MHSPPATSNVSFRPWCDSSRGLSTPTECEETVVVQVASSSVLNTPNCSIDCGAINREPCSADEACGDCLNGFVGAIAPSREACWISRRRTTTCTETELDCGGQCAPCAVGASCEMDSDCKLGWCDGAASGLGTCGVPAKLCPASCLGHGTCEYSDVTGAWLAARDCTIDRWSCSAACVCDPGYHGAACSLDAVAYQEIASLRSTLVDSLEMASSMQDTTAAAMNVQASSLSSLTTRPLELRGTAVQAAALALATSIAEKSCSTGLVGGTAASIGRSLSNLCDTDLVKRMNNTANTSAPSATPTMTTTSDRRFGSIGDGASDPTGVTSILRAVGLLSAAQVANNVAGEDPLTVDTDNIMMVSQRSYASTAASAGLSLPINGAGNAPAVVLGASAFAYDETGSALEVPYAIVDTQWQQWGVNIISSDVVTTSPLMSLRVIFDSHGSMETDDGRRRRVAAKDDDNDATKQKHQELSFVLHTLNAIDYSLLSDSMLVNLSCAAGFIGRASKVCPSTNATVFTNCTGEAVDVQLTCATNGVPTCLRWDPHLKAYETESCSVRNFSDINVTCSCDPLSFVASPLNGGSHFTSGSEQLFLFFASTFQPSAGFGPSLFLQNPLLMFTFAFIAFYALLSFALGHYADARDRLAWAAAKESAKCNDVSFESAWHHAHSNLPPFMHNFSLCHTNLCALLENHPCVRTLCYWFLIYY